MSVRIGLFSNAMKFLNCFCFCWKSLIYLFNWQAADEGTAYFRYFGFKSNCFYDLTLNFSCLLSAVTSGDTLFDLSGLPGQRASWLILWTSFLFRYFFFLICCAFFYEPIVTILALMPLFPLFCLFIRFWADMAWTLGGAWVSSSEMVSLIDVSSW